MLLQIPEVLTAEEVARCREVLDAAEWVDGGVTAGAQSGRVKRNMQIPEGSPAHRQLGEAVLTALGRSPHFLSGALPQRVFPPLFNRYEGGQQFGAHVDNAIRQLPGGAQRLRTDLSATLFFTGPDDYEGGELVIEDTYGEHRVKGPAGSLVLYPSTSLHHVTPVTQGARIASFFWIQSMVRDDGQRTMLYNLDTTIQKLRDESAAEERLVELTAHYHNLLRRWADT